MINIHWFPGHMNKALHEIEEKIRIIDIVIEILDARCPTSSINENLEKVIQNKKKLVIFAKCDLADPTETELWRNYFKTKFNKILCLDLTKNNSKKEIEKAIFELGKEKRNKDIARGMKPQPIKTMIIGIPNVGKSSLINRLSNRNAAGVQNKPGYTRGEQWIKVNNDFILLDTPGILPMNYDDQKKAINLALVGSVKENILPNTELSKVLIDFLKNNYPNSLESRFLIKNIADYTQVMEQICINRHILNNKGEYDFNRAEILLLKEFKDGLLGKISLEKYNAIRL